MRRLFVLLALAILGLPGHTARAETFHACTGFIDTVPTTITTHGVWCLRSHLSTSIASGAAITIAANNVTIDCNNFRVGGLAAGNTSFANGISAGARENVAIRNCNIRGFHRGINLPLGSGHLVEDNRLDNNLYIGIYIVGGNAVVRRNQVFDTGGAAGGTESFAIQSGPGMVTDNFVRNVFAGGANPLTWGIRMYGRGMVRGNQVAGVTAPAGGFATGIVAFPQSKIADNLVEATNASSGVGIQVLCCSGNAACTGNAVAGFSTPVGPYCSTAGGANDVL